MKTINLNLTDRQVHAICDALNREAKRFNDMATNGALTASAPKDSINCWFNAAGDRQALVRDLIGFLQADRGNTGAPFVSDTFRRPGE